MLRGHNREGIWQALELAAKVIVAASKVTVNEKGRDRVCHGKGMRPSKKGREGVNGKLKPGNPGVHCWISGRMSDLRDQ